jgi:glycosyltransferase involved in cell wall biosynthesis/SAM-dependent methyltransferase
MSETFPANPSLGVNVAGFLRGGLGLGQAARLYVAALAAAGVPVRTTTIDVPMPEVAGAIVKSTDFTDRHTEDEPAFNLVCVNAPELPAFRAEVGADFFSDKYTIGVWAWETDAVPASWDHAFALVDEIWVYSSYIVELLSHVAPVPVVRVPLPILPPSTTETQLSIDVPDAFTFLFVFDFFSTLPRKNPLGLIDAFKRAFKPGEGPHLLLKSFNGDYKPDRLAQLQAATDGRADIHVVDKFLPESERARLMERCDAYVSLHRAEGFGLTLGEAMALGKPVIATGFSGNLDFMTATNSYLVDYEMTRVGPDAENYPADGQWAEPDLDHAAALMREVWEDQDAARQRGARASHDIAAGFSIQGVGDLARRRLKRLSVVGRTAGVRAAASDGRTAPSGLPMDTWLERARVKLGYDPMRDAVKRGGTVGLLRRAALQSMRAYTYHQDELNELLVNAIGEVNQRFDDLVLDSQAQALRLEQSLARLQSKHDEVARTVRDAGLTAARALDLGRVLEGASARPSSAHPAISYIDEQGRRALGYTDAVANGGGGYRAFEDIFRGSEEQIRESQEHYLREFENASWVLDLGCGRGEFLEALRDRGISGRGVDLDPTMVDRCRQKGLDVTLGSAFDYLSQLEDGTVPGVFASQVIEHLSAAELDEFLTLVHRKLAQGGVVVLETVNPHNPAALKAFWTDTTHHHPLFPEVVLAMTRIHGFNSGHVVFPQSTENFDDDIYANRDYAVVARKAGTSQPLTQVIDDGADATTQ